MVKVLKISIKGVHEIGENDETGVNNKIIENDETRNQDEIEENYTGATD